MDRQSIDKKFLTSMFFFIFMSYVLTWFYLIPNALYSHQIISFQAPGLFSYIAAYSPAINAVVMTLNYGSKGSLRILLRRIILWRVPVRWYLAALFLQPVILLTALGLAMLLGGQAPDFNSAAIFSLGKGITPSNAIAAFLPYLLLQMVSVLGEEVGWRGFALSKLLSRYNWVVASMILGLVWAAWHIPLFFTAGTVQAELSPVWYNVDLLASAFLFTWLYLHTKGSLLLAVIFHASINSFAVFLPVVPGSGQDITPYIISIILKWLLVGGIVIYHSSKGQETPDKQNAA